MNGGQQNQSGYSSGFYGTSPIQRQNREMYNNSSFGSGSMYSMHQPHNAFSHQAPDNSPIKISPAVPDTSVEQFSAKQKLDNAVSVTSQCITSLERYSPYTLEELRCADYKKGRKGVIVPRQSGFSSPYSSTSSYLQKKTDLSGTGYFGQKPPDAVNSFASLSQSGFTSQSRPAGSGIFSSSASNTSSPNIFGQPTTNSFMGSQNSSFANQGQNNSFQKTAPLGGFGGFGQSGSGLQSQPSTNVFGSGQQTLSSNGFLNNSSLLGSGTGSAQQPSSTLGITPFRGGMDTANSQTPGSQSTFGMLGTHSPLGAGINNTGSAFSAGNTSSMGSSVFGGQQTNSMGGIGSFGTPSFSQAGMHQGGPLGGANTMGGNQNSGLGIGAQAPGTSALGSNTLGSNALGSNALGSSGFGTQGGSSTQLGSGFGGLGGQNSFSSSLQTGNSSILGGSGVGGLESSKPNEIAATPQFSFGGGLGAQNTSNSSLGTGLGGVSSSLLNSTRTDSLGSTALSTKPSLPFSSGIGNSAMSSLGSGGGLQAQGGTSFGLGGGFGSGLLGDSKVQQPTLSSNNDPYLVKSLSFKESEEYKKKSRMEIPGPLFKKSSTTRVKFKALGGFKEFELQSPKSSQSERKKEAIISNLNENEYYTIPSIEEIKKMPNKKITGFVIGRKNHGRVEFQGEVDLTNMDLDSVISIVRIEDAYIFFDYDEDEMPPGEGINKPIRVVLENVIPYSHSSGSMRFLESSDPYYENIQSRVLANLPKNADIESSQFEPATGVLTLDCAHMWKR